MSDVQVVGVLSACPGQLRSLVPEGLNLLLQARAGCILHAARADTGLHRMDAFACKVLLFPTKPPSSKGPPSFAQCVSALSALFFSVCAKKQDRSKPFVFDMSCCLRTHISHPYLIGTNGCCITKTRQTQAPFHALISPARDISFFSPKKPIHISAGRSSGFASSRRTPSRLSPMVTVPCSASQQRSCRRFTLRSLFTGAAISGAPTPANTLFSFQAHFSISLAARIGFRVMFYSCFTPLTRRAPAK